MHIHSKLCQICIIDVTLALFTFRMLQRFELSTKHLTKSLPYTDFKENMGENQGCVLLIL